MHTPIHPESFLRPGNHIVAAMRWLESRQSEAPNGYADDGGRDLEP